MIKNTVLHVFTLSFQNLIHYRKSIINIIVTQVNSDTYCWNARIIEHIRSTHVFIYFQKYRNTGTQKYYSKSYIFTFPLELYKYACLYKEKVLLIHQCLCEKVLTGLCLYTEYIYSFNIIRSFFRNWRNTFSTLIFPLKCILLRGVTLTKMYD